MRGENCDKYHSTPFPKLARTNDVAALSRALRLDDRVAERNEGAARAPSRARERVAVTGRFRDRVGWVEPLRNPSSLRNRRRVAAAAWVMGFASAQPILPALAVAIALCQLSD